MGMPIGTLPSMVESSVRDDPSADSPVSLIITLVRIWINSDGPIKRCDKCTVDVSPRALRAD